MAELEYWLGLDNQIEDKSKQYVSLSSQLEGIINKYSRLEAYIDSEVNFYSGLQENVEGFDDVYLAQQTRVVNVLFRWMGFKFRVEGTSNVYTGAFTDIVGKNIKRWLQTNVNVEGFDNLFVNSDLEVEEVSNYYSGISGYYQNQQNSYIRTNSNIESFLLNYIRTYINVEQVKDYFSKVNSNIEAFSNKYINCVTTVENLDYMYCGLGMFVRPKVFVNPDFGEYDYPVDVEILPELPAQIIKYSFGKNEGYYEKPLHIITDKKLSIEVIFDDGYTVKKEGFYKIKNIQGYTIYRDIDNLVFIDEDVLWKKE